MRTDGAAGAAATAARGGAFPEAGIAWAVVLVDRPSTGGVGATAHGACEKLMLVRGPVNLDSGVTDISTLSGGGVNWSAAP